MAAKKRKSLYGNKTPAQMAGKSMRAMTPHEEKAHNVHAAKVRVVGARQAVRVISQNKSASSGSLGAARQTHEASQKRLGDARRELHKAIGRKAGAGAGIQSSRSSVTKLPTGSKFHKPRPASRLRGGAVSTMGQLGRKHDAGGGMAGSYKPTRSLPKKLSVHTQQSDPTRHIKQNMSFHADENATTRPRKASPGSSAVGRKFQSKSGGATGPQKEKEPLGPLMRGKKGGSYRMSKSGKKVYSKK